MYFNQTSPTRSSMRAMLGGRDQMYGQETGQRAPSYDAYRNDHSYNMMATQQNRFKPSTYNEPLNFNYDAYLKKDYMNQSDILHGGGGSSAWGGAATTAASYKTGLGRQSAEGRGSRYDIMEYSKQDYLKYQIGSGLLQQNYQMDDSRFNE